MSDAENNTQEIVAQTNEEPATAGGVVEVVDISDEMARDYIDYSMSVIIGRALPDSRDGMKPVHRRSLYGMHRLNLTAGVKHKKSASVVGEVMGKYHPHGDSSIYDTIVRMAQPFSMRMPLVNGHGNFGSIDGDPAAAMRYTEVRMEKVAEEMLEDLEKDTVDMVPNYDETLKEPSVLPAKLPNLLLNGCSGIAVGMATNIPPHNLGELCDAITYYIDNRDCSIDELLQFVKGPDFPTGAQICGKNGILAMYKTGRGQIRVRGKATVEDDWKPGRARIIITELPYAVNKAELIKHIGELARDKVVEGISDVRDETARDDIRIVVECKRDAVGDIVLNHLYKHTELQTTFGANMLAIDHGRPKMLTLKDFFRAYADHRFDVITRRTRFNLAKAEARKHILDGLLLAQANLDDVVHIIRSSNTRDDAKARLVEKFRFTEVQVNSILEMRLYQLTGLERGKLEEELAALLADIAEYNAILADPAKVYGIMKDDLASLKERFATRKEGLRRIEIVADANEVSLKDLIADEPCVITLSNRGYIKRVPLTEYKEQGRGGRGIKGATSKDEDFVRLVFVAETHDSLMFFTNTGRLFLKGAYEIPEFGRTSPGRPLVNFLNLQEGEQVLRLLPIRSFEGDVDVMFATAKGTVKKTLLGAFKNVNRNGIKALNIEDADELVEVRLVKPGEEVLIVTHGGMAARFSSNDVRRMGRTATGVRGIRLIGADTVASMDVVDFTKTFLLATENGFGKRTEFSTYRLTRRGSQGLRAIKGEERNGRVVAGAAVRDDESIVTMTSSGMMVRQKVCDIMLASRSAMGVRLVRLAEGESLISMSVIEAEQEPVAAPSSAVAIEDAELPPPSNIE
ncbi:MAG: DNA gyrase subunit A [Kiritimatiellae bacterium]|nr:DNA gyrase subunit A [Kiritimatiellia bacterium]